MPTLVKLEFHPEAIDETREARSWYRARSLKAEKDFLAELPRAILHVRESPGTWPRFEPEARRFLLHRFPFSVVYRIKGEAVQILALAHGKRRPAYWARRR